MPRVSGTALGKATAQECSQAEEETEDEAEDDRDDTEGEVLPPQLEPGDGRLGADTNPRLPDEASAVLGRHLYVPLADGAVVPAVLYAPPVGTAVLGLLVAAPGSNGGTGPGLETRRAGLPLARCHSAAADGSIYWRLGCELCTGHEYDWRGHAAFTEDTKSMGEIGKGTISRACQRTPASTTASIARVAMLHISWRHTAGGARWPGGKLKRISSLRDAAADFRAAAAWLRSSFAGQAPGGRTPPLVLVGFSFGSPAAWAAGAALAAEGDPPCGVVAMAGSGRGGKAFEDEALDTGGCMAACARAGVCTLLLNGTNDSNVDLDVAHHFYHISKDAAAIVGQASVMLAVLAGSSHMLNVARGTAFAVLKSWVLLCLRDALVAVCGHEIAAKRQTISNASMGKDVAIATRCRLCSQSKTPLSDELFSTFSLLHRRPGTAVAVMLRGSTTSRLRAERYEVPLLSREELVRRKTKGYSEIGLKSAT